MIRFFSRGLRGLDPEHIIEQVGRTETRIGIRSLSRGSVYRRVGAWFIEQRYLNASLLPMVSVSSGVKIPDFCINFSTKGISRALAATLLSDRIRGTAGAQAIRVKNNVRAYYTRESVPFASKIQMGKTRRVEDMKNEIRIRNMVTDYDTVKIPRILQYDTEHDPPFFCEEIISGRKADPQRDGERIFRDLCPRLWRTYERHGVFFKGIQEAVGPDCTWKRLEEACRAVEWEPSWGDRETFLGKARELFESEAVLPLSTGHGDLSLGNMIIDREGEVYLADWECAKEMPLVFDLFSILKVVPQAGDFVASKMEDLASENREIPILPFRRQYFLAVLARITAWERSGGYLRTIGASRGSFQEKLARNLEYAARLLQG